MVRMETQAPTAARVLVVDDDPTVSDVVRRYLERAGFVVDRPATARPRSPSPPSVRRTWSCSTSCCRECLGWTCADGCDGCPTSHRHAHALGEEADRVVRFETGADDT